MRKTMLVSAVALMVAACGGASRGPADPGGTPASSGSPASPQLADAMSRLVRPTMLPTEYRASNPTGSHALCNGGGVSVQRAFFTRRTSSVEVLDEYSTAALASAVYRKLVSRRCEGSDSSAAQGPTRMTGPKVGSSRYYFHFKVESSSIAGSFVRSGDTVITIRTQSSRAGSARKTTLALTLAAVEAAHRAR